MAGFEVKRYGKGKPKMGYAARVSFCALMGVTALTAGCGRRTHLAGDVMPAALPRLDAVEEADSLLESALGSEIAHDVPLCLTDRSGLQTRIIEFIADGYDEKRRIAYEVLDYYPPGTNRDPALLDGDEMDEISGYRFGENYILVFTYPSRIDIRDEINRFLIDYTNGTE